jgi:hypothetical protein
MGACLSHLIPPTRPADSFFVKTTSNLTGLFARQQTIFAIEVHVPIHYDKFDDSNYTKELSEKLYPLVKEVNTNPKVDTVKVIFYAQKYFGAFPISKSKSTPKKMSEI